MSFRYQRKYVGKVRGIIFDWAGTTVDYGCLAPTNVFIAGFKAEGIDITLAEARAPMGRGKRDHIAEIMSMPRVTAEWERVHNTTPTDSDVQKIYDAFLPRQIEVVTQYADLIPGTTKAIEALRERGLQIGSCTGYTRAIMDALIPVATENGYSPDFVVTADEVPSGRPAPWMAIQNARLMNIYPMEALIKVGDTSADIQEGLNAGMWTIGIAKTGNEMGLSKTEIATLSQMELAGRLSTIYRKLYQVGSHFVIDDLSELPQVVDQINEMLSMGQKPN